MIDQQLVTASAVAGRNGFDPGTHRRTLLRGSLILSPLLVLLLLWIWLFAAEGAFRGGPAGKAFGADFAMFVGAAKVLTDGGNPYDSALLYRTERAYLAGQQLPILRERSVVRVGNPPLFFWLLAPLANGPFQPESYAWTALLYLLSAAGFLAVLRHLRWRRWKLALLIFLLMPEVILGPFYGNVVDVVFCCVACALLWMGSRPVITGALLTAAWLKPPVALPIVLLIVLFHAPRPREVIGGFLGGSTLLALVTIAVAGTAGTSQWINGMVGYSHTLASSPAIASLTGAYIRNTPPSWQLILETAILGTAIISTCGACWHQRRSGPVSIASIAWLWILWFLATPYAHFYDEILLVIPVAALLGVDGVRSLHWNGAAALYLALISLLVISAAPGGVELLWIPTLLLLCVSRAQRHPVVLAPQVPARVQIAEPQA